MVDSRRGCCVLDESHRKISFEDKGLDMQSGVINPDNQNADDIAESNFSKGKTVKKLGVVIIINSIIWGLVIIGCSLTLKSTGAYIEIQNILAGGSIASLLLLAVFSKKLKDQPET